MLPSLLNSERGTAAGRPRPRRRRPSGWFTTDDLLSALVAELKEAW